MKPAREDGGFGIDSSAVVRDETRLRERVAVVLRCWIHPDGGPALSARASGMTCRDLIRRIASETADRHDIPIEPAEPEKGIVL